MALSFAFFTRQESEAIVREASTHSIKIIEKLCETWALPLQQAGQMDAVAPIVPDVFTINVPLVENVSENATKWTWMLDNKWPTGSLYKPVEASQKSSGGAPSFTWSPSFTDMWKIVDASPQGNDGLVIRQNQTSITPIKASFQGLHGQGAFFGDFKL